MKALFYTRSSQLNEVSNKKVETFSQEVENMKLRITIDGKEVTATLADNATTRDLISLLPLILTLEDYAKTEKVSDLPKRLTTQGAPAGSDPDVGDIAYYAPWGNLAIFYKDGQYSDGLVILGKIDGDMAKFKAAGPLKATVDLMK